MSERLKLIRIISEHTQTKSRGQVEAIVQRENGQLVTRHLYPQDCYNWKEVEK